MLVRDAVPVDIPAMMAIAAGADTAAHWTSEAYARIFESSLLHEPTRLALVVEDSAGGAGEAQIVGFIVALCAEREWEIENIVVMEAAQRRGLAMRLLDEFLNRAWAAGVEAVFLEVRETNLAARALYEKRGFLTSGRRPGYYCEPEEDAVLYRFRVAAGKKF